MFDFMHQKLEDVFVRLKKKVPFQMGGGASIWVMFEEDKMIPRAMDDQFQ